MNDARSCFLETVRGRPDVDVSTQPNACRDRREPCDIPGAKIALPGLLNFKSSGSPLRRGDRRLSGHERADRGGLRVVPARSLFNASPARGRVPTGSAGRDSPSRATISAQLPRDGGSRIATDHRCRTGEANGHPAGALPSVAQAPQVAVRPSWTVRVQVYGSTDRRDPCDAHRAAVDPASAGSSAASPWPDQTKRDPRPPSWYLAFGGSNRRPSHSAWVVPDQFARMNASNPGRRMASLHRSSGGTSAAPPLAPKCPTPPTMGAHRPGVCQICPIPSTAERLSR